MQEKESFASFEESEASLHEGGGTADGGDGGSKNTPPSDCPTDSQLPQGGSLPKIESEQKDWYVDLTREEFVSFRMLLAKVNGPLKMRIPTMIMAALCCVAMAALALFEWQGAGFKGYPDPILLVGALLVLLPGFYTWFYVPAKMKKSAGQQYDRSVQSGMNYCGRLDIYPDSIEKVGATATAHVDFDQRTLFIETAEMMVFTAAGSPAVVLPGRCMTDALAQEIRRAADRMPPQNRRFIARLRTQGEVVPAPTVSQPEELWVATFTYTEEEYATVLKGLLIQHFWRMSPLLMATAVIGSLMFGWDGQSLLSCVPFFLVMAGIFLLFNLILPLSRVKHQVPQLSAHDRTMQVRMDTLALRLKLPKGGENWVLWCDVDHVYDKGDFVEIVHNKRANLHIPKRCIEDIETFDAVVTRCRAQK